MDTQRHTGRLTALIASSLLVLVTAVTSVTTAPEAEAGPRYVSRTRRIAPGLTLTKMRDTWGPNRIRILRLDPTTDLTLDLALANDTLPGRERTTSMARRRGAIAAVNATRGTDWGRPLGLFAEDGTLKTSRIAPGAAFSLARSERRAYVGWPRLDVHAESLVTGTTWEVADWNEEEPSPRRIAGYTRAGGEVVTPPSDACSVRLVPTSKLRWTEGRMGVERTHVVDEVACAAEPMALERGLVLAAPQGTAAASQLSLAIPGESIDLGWSVGWQGALDVVSGNPVLVKDGVMVAEDCDAPVCDRNPRTGIGFTAKGRILLVTVDGRQSGSVGMDMVGFGKLMRRLGAVTALNLDGGGSTTMVVNGRIVNVPSDGVERRVASSLLILPGRDRLEPVPRPAL